MRCMRLAATGLALCFATAGLLAQKQLVLVGTVSDPSGAEVTEVNPSDVEFTENGAAGKVLKVEQVAAVVPKVQILVDNGIGMPKASLGDLRTAMRALINTIPSAVEVTLVTTAPQPRMLEKATTDRARLLSAVDRLTPDDGTGRFVESLYEATDRIVKDRQEGAAYTILSVATSSGDLNFRENDVKQLVQRVQQKRTMVHVVLLSNLNSGSGGGIQTDLGKGLADMVGGRFESIAVPNRLISLLPEIGKQMAGSLTTNAKQFRITLERPGDAAGDLGQVRVGINGKVLSNLGVAPAR